MSIMVLNKKTIEKLSNNYIIMQEATGSSNLTRYENTLKGLYDLNIRSWNERYPNDLINNEEKENFYKLNFNTKEKFNNPCEILKAFQCLKYNIELTEENSNDKRLLKELDGYINGLTSYIISNLEEYKKAIWA